MRSHGKRLLLLFFALLFASHPGGAAASAGSAAVPAGTEASGRKWALLVGVDDYQHPDVADLRFTSRDVELLAKALVRPGSFHGSRVIRMSTGGGSSTAARPTRLAVLKQLDELAAQIGPDDLFLFYFSGHGFLRAGGEHFLGTVDADPTTTRSLESTTISLAQLQERIARIRARQVVFIIDACRNDPLAGKGGGANVLTEAFSRDLVRVARSAGAGLAGAAVLFACSKGERAYEWTEKQHGIFTYYLLEGLAGRAADVSEEVTINGLADYVQQQVRQWAADRDRDQTPDLEQSGAARIVLARNVRNPQLPIAVPTERALKALHQLQALNKEHAHSGPRGNLERRGLFLSGDQLLMLLKWKPAQSGKVPDEAPRRVSAPLAALDPYGIEMVPDPSGTRFGVFIKTRGGEDAVAWVNGKETIRRAAFRIWYSDEAAAQKAAVLFRELLTALAPAASR